MDREEIIRKYFQSWIDKNITVLEQIFSNNVIYSECYGPEYHGLPQVIQWFTDWNKRGSVLKWDIKRFIHQDMVTVVEWYFQCNYDDEIGGFDGVSIIEFDQSMKIIRLQEFQSKAEHIYPYDSLQQK